MRTEGLFHVPLYFSCLHLLAIYNFANKGIDYESGKCKGVVLPGKEQDRLCHRHIPKSLFLIHCRHLLI